ncbi:MAG: hypothetical protein E7214_00420 [Clostridium sp.]|nr:hypothetical protein [Clostridium sp.]
MRYRIENFEDITDAKSFMNAYKSSCSYTFLKYTMYIIVVILFVLTAWSMYAEKDIVVNAFGEIDMQNNKCNIYIENTSIGGVKEGDTVQLEIVSLSKSDYGVIKSTINSISEEVSIDKSSGKKYYSTSCNIDNDTLVNKNGGKVKLKSGMESKVSIITYKTTYFNYILRQII